MILIKLLPHTHELGALAREYISCLTHLLNSSCDDILRVLVCELNQLQRLDEDLPGALNRGDVHLLVGRVGRAKVWTNGDHIHIRHDALDDTTLQPCVDDGDLGGLTRDLFVSTAHRLEDGGVSIGRPAVVSTCELDLCTARFIALSI